MDSSLARFFTDKYLKYRAAMRGGPIEGDRACEGCGYNLRGLRFGGRCPECGVPIRFRRDPNIPFYEMPLDLIRSFRASAWMALLSMAGVMVLLFGGARFVGTDYATALLVAMLAIWLIAVWRLTPALDQPQAVARGFGRSSRLRLAARWLQLAWIGNGFSGVAVAVTGGGAMSPVQLIVSVLTWLAGMGGVLCLAVLLGRLADWARDPFAEKAFATCVWGAALVVPVALMIPVMGLIADLLAVFGMAVAATIMLVSLLAFPVGLLRLTRTVDWALVHARERVDRGREMAERMVRSDRPAGSALAGDGLIPLADETAGDDAAPGSRGEDDS